jgi:hypothetical protein
MITPEGAGGSNRPCGGGRTCWVALVAARTAHDLVPSPSLATGVAALLALTDRRCCPWIGDGAGERCWRAYGGARPDPSRASTGRLFALPLPEPARPCGWRRAARRCPGVGSGRWPPACCSWSEKPCLASSATPLALVLCVPCAGGARRGSRSPHFVSAGSAIDRAAAGAPLPVSPASRTARRARSSSGRWQAELEVAGARDNPPCVHPWYRGAGG